MSKEAENNHETQASRAKWEFIQIALEEYKSLRSEIINKQGLIINLVQFNLAFIGAIFAAAFASKNPYIQYITLLVIVPCIVVFVSFYCTYESIHIKRIGRYISEIEHKVNQKFEDSETRTEPVLFWELVQRVHLNRYLRVNQIPIIWRLLKVNCIAGIMFLRKYHEAQTFFNNEITWQGKYLKQKYGKYKKVGTYYFMSFEKIKKEMKEKKLEGTWFNLFSFVFKPDLIRRLFLIIGNFSVILSASIAFIHNTPIFRETEIVNLDINNWLAILIFVIVLPAMVCCGMWKLNRDLKKYLGINDKLYLNWRR